MNRHSREHYIAILAIALVLALVPVILGERPYLLRLATHMLALMGFAIGFNIIFGHTRQLFLSTGALAGLAAYFTVILSSELTMSWALTLPVGVIVAATVGSLISFISVRRRLQVIFVGLLTFAFSLVFQNVVLGLSQITGGEDGLVTFDPALGWLRDLRTGYYSFLVLILVFLLMYSTVIRSKIGLGLSAIVDDEYAAELSGVDVVRFKVAAAFSGSAIIGISGVMFGYFNVFIGPEMFRIQSFDVAVIIAVLLGGMGTLVGPVIGAMILSVVDELVRPLGPLSQLIYGLMLIVLFSIFRQGIVGAVRRVVRVHIP